MDTIKPIRQDLVEGLGLVLSPVSTAESFIYGLTYYKVPNIKDEVYITNCDEHSEQPDLSKRGLLKIIGWRRHGNRKIYYKQFISGSLDTDMVKEVLKDVEHKLANPPK